MKADLHQTITNNMIELIEAGTLPWVKNWHCNSADSLIPVNYSTGKEYSGINILSLWASAQIAGYSCNSWLTFKQAKNAGGSVRKGEKSTLGVFYKVVEKRALSSDEKPEKYFLAKPFYLFNLDQISGIDLPEAKPEAKPVFSNNERIENLVRNSGAKITESGNKAFYHPASDSITMPNREQFFSIDNFYSTLLHEMAHWTKHKTRLDRSFSDRYESHKSAYAFEELVAELSSAFLSARLNLAGSVENHASYLDSWLSVLKSDKKAIFSAASFADKATKYLMAFDTAADHKNVA